MSVEVTCDGCKRKIPWNDHYFRVIAKASETITDYEMGGKELPSIVEKQFCNECVFGCHHKIGEISKGHIEFSRFLEWKIGEGYDKITIEWI